MSNEIERRTTVQEATVEYRDMGNGEKKPVISGYAAVFNSESRNLGGFVETIHPNAFDDVLAEQPDVIGVFNHDRNLLLGRTGNGSMRLMKDPYGLRYEIMPNENTSVGRDVVQWVKDRTVVGSSFAFAVRRDGGDSWSTDGQRGIRKREVRQIGLLEDVGPVVRPAYDSSSVVVSRRAIEMALGESFRPVQTMANASKRGLKLAQRHENVDSRLLCIAERVANREIVSVEEVSYLAGVYERCLAAKVTGWSGSPAWIEWQLAGGDAGEKWVDRRAASAQPEAAPSVDSAAEITIADAPAEERAASDVSLVPSAGMAAAAKRGLALHEAGRSGDGLKPETVSRAGRIAARDELTPEHVREMRAWFRRHKVDKKAGWSTKGAETPGYTAWMLWGGDAGWRWSEAKVAQMERESGQRDIGEDAEGMEEEYPGTLSQANLDLAEAQEMIAADEGQWPQDGASGAHYMGESPFSGRGIMCANCVFFEGGGACEIVQGDIDPNGVCKFWIIPEERMSAEDKKPEPAPVEDKPAEDMRAEQDAMDIAIKLAGLKASILRTQLHGAPKDR
jgi:HK97 family phage prohead protease